MKKQKDQVSASDILNILEFIHSGISWIPEGKMHQAQVGDVKVQFDPKTKQLEFRAPLAWVQMSTPNENSAKRMVSDIRDQLKKVKGTNALLEVLHSRCTDTSGMGITLFWGL